MSDATFGCRLRAAWRAARAAWSAAEAVPDLAATAVDPAPAPRPSAPPAAAPLPADGPPCAQLVEVLQRSTDYVVQTDVRGAITWLNPAAREALGLRPEDPLGGLSFQTLATATTQRLFAEQVGPVLRQRGVWVGETTMNIGEREGVPFSHMAMAHRDADGRLQRFSAVMRDITADVQSRQQVQRHTDVLAAITEAIPATVVIVDAQGRYRFVNGAFERHVGKPASEIIGRTAIEVLGAAEVARRKPWMLKAFAGEAVDFVLDYPGADGTRWLALSCIPMKLDGQVDGFVGISQDITAQRLEQQRLAELAERDPLTGLYNRTGLQQRMAAREATGEDGRLALLYIDLDHFKPVNDRHGHAAGDALLCEFANRLQRAVRSSDLVVRLGGDEFAVLLVGCHDPAVVRRIADTVLAAAEAPCLFEGRELRISASVGMALSRPEGESLAMLMQRADALLYAAKGQGRGRACEEEAAAAPLSITSTV
ncbi:MAG: hypothetical protein RIQ53_4673 [Pseudomonadota bacterium]|jgi:diguanylate cyclase (GGDEF)-like protein/PAS domain S-box-containing protein